MSSDPLVIFTPSGKRGRFPKGTPVLTAARQGKDAGRQFMPRPRHSRSVAYAGE